jgi:hypothetical protein
MTTSACAIRDTSGTSGGSNTANFTASLANTGQGATQTAGPVTPKTTTDFAIFCSNNASGLPDPTGYTKYATGFWYKQLSSIASVTFPFTNTGVGVSAWANALALCATTNGIVTPIQNTGAAQAAGAHVYTMSNPVTAGNAIIVTVPLDTPGGVPADTTVSDSKGNVYSFVGTSYEPAGYGVGAWIFVALNCAAGSTGVTVTIPATQFSPGVTVAEFSGLAAFAGPVVSQNFPNICMNVAVTTSLYKTFIDPTLVTANQTINEGRPAIVLDFNSGDGLYARDLGTIFSWSMSCRPTLRIWQPSLLPMPENVYQRPSDWDDGGHEGAKFIQGIIIEADSFNLPKTFALQSDADLSLHSLLETPATFNKQSIQAFSCVPFVCHQCRVISTDNVAWRVWSSKLIFQPWPELTINWQTEMTSLGLTGWGHVRQMNIAHVSTTDLTLTLTFDAWPTITLTIPNSGGLQAKAKVTLPANKFKLIGLKITSTAAFRLFEGDIELKVKQWGSTESYQVLKPFGGPSRTGAIV